jgi:hypothetical protein
MALTGEFKALFIDIAEKLKGNKCRTFRAQVVKLRVDQAFQIRVEIVPFLQAIRILPTTIIPHFYLIIILLHWRGDPRYACLSSPQW